MKVLTGRARPSLLTMTLLVLVSTACTGNQARLRQEALGATDRAGAGGQQVAADPGSNGLAATDPAASRQSDSSEGNEIRRTGGSGPGSRPASPGGTASSPAAAARAAAVAGSAPGVAGASPSSGPTAGDDSARSPGPSTALNPGTTDVGVTADKITIGGVWFHESFIDRYSRPEERAVRAFFNDVNRAGGIHGRKIEYIACTDGGDNSRARACFKDLVENRKVFMLGPSASFATGTIQDYVKAQRIPFVGSFGLYLEEFRNDNPYSFPTQVPAFHNGRLLGKHIVDEVKPKSVGISYLNIEAAEECMVGLEQYLSKAGIPVVAKVSNEADEPDLTPQVLRMRQAGPGFVAFCNDPLNNAKFVSAARGQRYKPDQGWSAGFSVVPEFGKIVGEWGIGHYGFSSVCYHEVPECDADPDVRLFKDQLTRYYPGELERMHYYGQNLWCGAKMITEALRLAGPNLTRASLLSVLDSGAFFNWTCQGMQLFYKAGLRAGSRVGQMLQLDDKLRWRLVKPMYRAD